MAETILESISDGVFTVDLDWRITYFNQAAVDITGVSKEEAIGRFCSEVFKSNMCEQECPLRRTLQSRQPLINRPGFLVKPDGSKVPITVSTAIMRDEAGTIVGGAETFRDMSEIEDLRQQLHNRTSFGNLSSSSPALIRILDILPVYATSQSTILISGETGTGKEVLARAIHAASAHSGGPFIAINCGALPDSLLESELFGFRKGAFTGADRDKPGRFAAAQDGTLFLDELGEISVAMQVKLLRVLQEREYEPLGANHPKKTNARIIAASNRDLKELVKTGAFRQDLYYRVNVLSLEMPPLRHRPEDIPQLTEYFVAKFNRLMNKRIRGFSATAYALLYAYPWPGNIRELENVVERAVVICPSEIVEPRHLPAELSGSHGKAPLQSETIRQTRQDVERQAILQTLESHDWNRSTTARELGINKATLYRKIAALGLTLPEYDGRSHNSSKNQ